jgi:hypothetical protein
VSGILGTGGLPDRRPDQTRNPPLSGTQPGSSSVVRARVVVISGAAGGLFVYSGTPGLGNPPILAITTASTDPYGNVVTPVAITDSGMPLLIYSGTPALGNLIVSLAPAAGVDSFGNSYPEGLNVTTGIIEALSVSASTETLNPGPLLLYGNATTVVQYLSGSGNWPVPATVSAPDGTANAVMAECWGGGGGGHATGGGVSTGNGGGGGEYAAEPHLAVTPSGTAAYVVGGGGGPGANGVASTFAGTSVTVTANPGQFGIGSGGAAGSGSTNTVHHQGGLGGTYTSGTVGAGGGGGGGTVAVGGNGHNSGGGGAGGTGGPIGGGAGGAGATTAGGNGSAGTVPGGGGGGSGSNVGGGVGGAGAAGQIRVSYIVSGGAALLASLASAAGVDPNTGTSYPGPGLGLASLSAAPSALAGFTLLYAVGQSLAVAGTGFLGNMLAVHPGTTITPESWQGPLAAGNSWTGNLYYRLNPFNAVDLVAGLATPAAAVNGTIFTLPVGYRPTNSISFDGTHTLAANFEETWTLNHSGTLVASGFGASSSVNICQSVPLDAP